MISNLSSQTLSELINSFEKELKSRRPEAKYIYIEPDLQEWKYME